MPTQKNITYLLGAGASYNALPLVKEIPKELDRMLEVIIRFEKKHYRYRYENEFSKTRQLITEISKSSSIDTLARKFWLLSRENTSDEDYLRIKNLITALIIFAQLNATENSRPFSERKDRRIFSQLDHRYDAFLAALLTPEIYLPSNINILSWNYDFQLEKAMQFYSKETSIFKVGEQLGISYKNPAHMEPRNIVKLNGTALFSDTANTHFKFDAYDAETHNLFAETLKDEINKDYYPLIHFAWETASERTDVNRSQAKKIIGNSDFVVIIGYSFPVFNREVDIEVFSDFKGEKVYIQDVPERVDQLRQQLDIIKIGLSNKCEIQTNCEQFLIPGEYWTYYDSYDDYLY